MQLAITEARVGCLMPGIGGRDAFVSEFIAAGSAEVRRRTRVRVPVCSARLGVLRR
jgi:hypothetical protein